MSNTANLDCLVLVVDKEQPVIAYSQPEFVYVALKLLYVSCTCFREAMQRMQYPHGVWLIESADIGLCRFGPGDALHTGSW